MRNSLWWVVLLKALRRSGHTRTMHRHDCKLPALVASGRVSLNLNTLQRCNNNNTHHHQSLHLYARHARLTREGQASPSMRTNAIGSDKVALRVL